MSTSTAVRTIAGIMLASGGASLNGATKLMDKAKVEHQRAEAERASRRRADPSGMRFSVEALTGTGARDMRLRDYYTEPVVTKLASALVAFILAGVLNVAATKLGRH